MGSINIVTMSGNLARDPELYEFDGGERKMCRFTICLNIYSKGESHTHYFNWLAWNKQAESIKKFFVKGSKITVSGKAVLTNKSQKNGKEYPPSVEFWVNEWDFAGERKATKAYREEQRKKEDFMDLPDDISGELPFE